ncbi:MAG: cysteine-rich repeat protein [Hyphomicrobiaceae bacterium]|jgi:cysteine-rich repeat protein
MEQCDEGEANSDALPNACRSDCTRARCGDGLVDSGEVCDDGNNRDDDACRNECVPSHCGDAVLCTAESCVSGPTGGAELCDDGNAIGSDDCTNACAPNVCGDGIAHTKGTPPFDTCDDGNNSDGDGCPGNCRVASCGDGFVCSDPECRSGPVGTPETCDDGNLIDYDKCRNDCSLNVCGDGVVRALGESPFEKCDTGARNSDVRPGACRSDCQPARCGDGVVDAGLGEQCDPGRSTETLDESDVVNCSSVCCYAGPTDDESRALAGSRCELSRLAENAALDQCSDAGDIVLEAVADAIAALRPVEGRNSVSSEEARQRLNELQLSATESCEALGGYTARDVVLASMARVRRLLEE